MHGSVSRPRKTQRNTVPLAVAAVLPSTARSTLSLTNRAAPTEPPSDRLSALPEEGTSWGLQSWPGLSGTLAGECITSIRRKHIRDTGINCGLPWTPG